MHAGLYSFIIPFKKPLILQRGVLSERHGLYLVIDGRIGEISPLPDFSRETLEEAAAEAVNLCRIINSSATALDIKDREVLLYGGENKDRNKNQSEKERVICIKSPSLQFALLMIKHPLTGIERKPPYRFILGTPDECILSVEKYLLSLSGISHGDSITGDYAAFREDFPDYQETVRMYRLSPVLPETDSQNTINDLRLISEYINECRHRNPTRHQNNIRNTASSLQGKSSLREKCSASVTIKLKIGIYPVEIEISMLREIVSLIRKYTVRLQKNLNPGNENSPEALSYSQTVTTKDFSVNIILDANLSLTPETLLKYISATEGFLKYIEDPCQDYHLLRKLCPGLPIAFDELYRKGLAPAVFSGLDTLIIKPGITDGIISLMEKHSGIQDDSDICNGANNTPAGSLLTHKTEPVQPSVNITLSSAFESVIGISYIEKLSEKLRLNQPGTDTLKYFITELQQ